MAGLDALHRPGLSAVGPGASESRVRRLRSAVLLLAVLFAAELMYAVLSSPRLAVREVIVRGDPRLAQVVAASISLPPNTNVLRAPLEEVKRQVEGIAAVGQARVGRSLPSRLVVTVERREPVAVIRRDDAAVLVDREGIRFSLPEERGWGLPELVAPDILSGDPAGDRGKGEVDLLLRVLQKLGNDPRIRATRLQLASDGKIEVLLDSGTRVSMGTEEQLSAKVRLLAAVLDQIGIENIARIDLADPEAAFWEPLGGSVAVCAR